VLKQDVIIPQPSQFVALETSFELGADTVIVANAGAITEAETLARALRPATGFALPVQTASHNHPHISLEITPDLEHLGPEGYELEVDATGARLRSSTAAGLFYAAQSLRQLLPTEIFNSSVTTGVNWIASGARITDTPRFAWRGIHLDVCRHFMPLSFIKRLIDLMALHKLNTFHWHLTEDQGWRLEIKKYPRLTEVGAWRSGTRIGHEIGGTEFDTVPHGGFYTQAEAKELVNYASDRHITVVPEIEMPGHAQAAIAAYPELGNTGVQLEVGQMWGVIEHVFNPSEHTIQFLQDVLLEVMDVFPGLYIHVGGDECPKREWRESPAAQARMQALGLKDEDELQSYIIRRMDAFLTDHGRKLIGWDEILEGGLSPNATVMSWRGEEGGIHAAKVGHDVVMVPQSHVYFDHYQFEDTSREPLSIGGFTSLEKVYGYDPIPAALSDLEAKHVLGSQSQLWTEYVPTTDHAEYMLFPRLCALAEVVWTPKEQKSYSGFLERMGFHVQRLDALGVNYAALLKESDSSVS
jgi:hexosaminidase